MTSFNRSPDDRQRPPGPRPFVGGNSAPTSRVLRPLAAARRTSAAPFATIHNELNIRETPPSEEPSVAVLSTPLKGLEAFTHVTGAPEACPEAPNESPASALTIDDLVPEGRPWFSDREPEDPYATVTPMIEPLVIEAPLEIVALVLSEAIAPAVDDVEANDPSVSGEAALAAEGAEERDPEFHTGHPTSDGEEWSGLSADFQQSVADAPQSAQHADRFETHFSSDWSETVADSPPAFSELPHLVPIDEFEREGDAAVAAMVPDEGSPWNASALARAYVAPELTSLAPVPVDNANDLEALVSETVGAERAVEVLEAVARLVRSREIVVSVGAGASAESVLASILASLLSDPS